MSNVVRDLRWQEGQTATACALAKEYPPGEWNFLGCYQWPTSFRYEERPFCLCPRDTSTSALFETPVLTWNSLPSGTIVAIFFDSRVASRVRVSRLPDVNHKHTWQDTIDLDIDWLNSWAGRVNLI